MHFGVPSKINKKIDKYPNTPVITLHPVEGKNSNRKIELNKKAFEILNFSENEINEIAFSFNPSNLNENLIINANSFDSGSNLKIKKNRSVANKRHYNEIKNRFNIEDKDIAEFVITETDIEYKNTPLWNIELMTEEIEEIASNDVESQIVE